MDNKEYSKLVKECTPKENLIRNIVISFIIGGFIGLLGNLLIDIYTYIDADI